MARARNIKPGLFKNEFLVEQSLFVRLLFVGLWTLADREGRLEDRPKRIKLELFPYDSENTDDALTVLAENGFIVRYQSAGINVIQIVNFLKHQTPHGTEKDSLLPDENGEFTVHERNKAGYVTGTKRNNNVKSDEINVELQCNNCCTPVSERHDSPNPDSPNPDSPNTTTNVVVKEKKPRKVSTVLSEDFYPDETGVAYADSKRISFAVELESFRNWHAARGSTMKDWQAAWRTWCDKAVEFGRSGNGQRPPAKTQHQLNQEATTRAIFGNPSEFAFTEKLISGEVIS